MAAARALLVEALDQALQAEGLAATVSQVDGLVEAVADSVEVMASEGAVRLEAWEMPLPYAPRREGAPPKPPDARLGAYWSGRTLQGLAVMLRRR